MRHPPAPQGNPISSYEGKELLVTTWSLDALFLYFLCTYLAVFIMIHCCATSWLASSLSSWQSFLFPWIPASKRIKALPYDTFKIKTWLGRFAPTFKVCQGFTDFLHALPTFLKLFVRVGSILSSNFLQIFSFLSFFSFPYKSFLGKGSPGIKYQHSAAGTTNILHSPRALIKI